MDPPFLSAVTPYGRDAPRRKREAASRRKAAQPFGGLEVAGCLVGAGVFRAFTSIGRLDVRTRGSPLVIPAGILRGHGQAPTRAVQGLPKTLSKSEAWFAMPDLELQAKRLAGSDSTLTEVDAECILYAEKTAYAILVADVAYGIECQNRGVPTSGVASVRLAPRRKNWLAASEAEALAVAMEAKGCCTFNADERTGLGTGFAPPPSPTGGAFLRGGRSCNICHQYP